MKDNGIFISPFLSDGAVLQRGEKIVIRGGGPVGAEVAAELTGPYGQAEEMPGGAGEADKTTREAGKEGKISRTAKTKGSLRAVEEPKCFRQSGIVETDGIWRLVFEPLPAGGPYRLVCQSGSCQLEVKDIWMGDVWLLAGQSNMQLPMERVKYRFPEQYQDGGLPLIRQFSVPIHWNFESPQRELDGGEWKRAVGKETAAFSAVGYFFGRRLFEKYRVPLGLVLTAVGGTPIQAWMSREALEDFPEELCKLDVCKAPGYVETVQKRDEERIRAWWRRLDEKDPGIRESWMDSYARGSTRGYPCGSSGNESKERMISAGSLATGWKGISLSKSWGDVPELNAPGTVWLRRQVDITPERAGIPVRISLGTITDADFLYVNGTLRGSTGYRYPPREYELEGLMPGINTIVVRVVAVHGPGGFTRGKRHAVVWKDGFAKDITDGWEYRRGAWMEPLAEQTFFERTPVGMYQGMTAPLKDFPIKGVCWYQGEMNADEYKTYPGYFRRLVSGWRSCFKKPDLPVLFVQLPNYHLEDAGNWVYFREMQRGLTRIPGTAMAVTIDCGEANDLHPVDKKTVGERLVMAALWMVYGESEGDLCPLFVWGRKGLGYLILHFSNAKGGLGTMDGKELGGFEYLYGKVYGKDAPEERTAAKVRIQGEHIIAELPRETEKKPSALVYAWSNEPADANLCNGKKLPASPFCWEL